jgi:hypothetical protein
MLAEAALAVAAFGIRLDDYASGFLTAAGALGLIVKRHAKLALTQF